MSLPPRIAWTPPSKGAQPDRGGGDIGRLGVVDEADPAALGDQLEPVRNAGEAAQPLADGVTVDPHRERRSGGRHRVLGVVLAEEAELGDRQQGLAVVEDRALGEGDFAVGGGTAAEGDAAGAAAEVGPDQLGIVGVVDGDVVVALVGEDPELGGEVGLEIAVAVEVVRRQVEEDGALGREEAGVLELEARGLADDRRLRVAPPDQARQRRADVAGDRDRLAGRPPDVPEQLDRGRLAVGAGDREEAIRQLPPRQLELPGHLDPPLQRRRDHRRLPGHSRALDDRPRSLELSKSICIQEDFDAHPPQSCRPFRISAVDRLDRLAAPPQQARPPPVPTAPGRRSDRGRPAAAGEPPSAAADSHDEASPPTGRHLSAAGYRGHLSDGRGGPPRRQARPQGGRGRRGPWPLPRRGAATPRPGLAPPSLMCFVCPL